MNAVGIDVAKGKSMITVMRPLGEVVAPPVEVGHTANELNELAKFILKLDGETRIVMEYTGVYNELFTSPPRKSDGHEKWLDFTMKFWHAECVCSLSQKAFTERYRKWCHKEGYNFTESKAEDIYISSCGHIGLLPKDEHTELLVQQTVIQLTSLCPSLAVIERKMEELASMLPEYPVVMAFYGVGRILGPQLIAEIGDIFRFNRKEALVCFAGLKPQPKDSGKLETSSRNISKKGSSHLRAALFQVMSSLLQNQPAEDPIYQFLDRKRSEGKNYYTYMCAGSAKFLRIYYARIKEYLLSLEDSFF